MTPQEISELEKLGLDVLDSRGSHLQLRCRTCGATWRPRRTPAENFPTDGWKCWRGCNERKSRENP